MLQLLVLADNWELIAELAAAYRLRLDCCTGSTQHTLVGTTSRMLPTVQMVHLWELLQWYFVPNG